MKSKRFVCFPNVVVLVVDCLELFICEAKYSFLRKLFSFPLPLTLPHYESIYSGMGHLGSTNQKDVRHCPQHYIVFLLLSIFDTFTTSKREMKNHALNTVVGFMQPFNEHRSIQREQGKIGKKNTRS